MCDINISFVDIPIIINTGICSLYIIFIFFFTHFGSGQHIAGASRCIRGFSRTCWDIMKWWETAAVGWSAPYINFLFSYSIKRWRENSSLRAVEWLRVCFECPLLDRCSSNNGRHGYRGGETGLSITAQPIHFHSRKLSVTWEVLARVSPERGRDWAGGWGEWFLYHLQLLEIYLYFHIGY